MMYMLSHGKVTGLKLIILTGDITAENRRFVRWQMCYAYESVPSCLDLDYDPGGSLSWTTTVTQAGPKWYGFI